MSYLVLDAATGVAGFIEGITTSFTSTAVWNEIIPVAGFVATMALIKIGYNAVRGVVNNSTRPGSKKVMSR